MPCKNTQRIAQIREALKVWGGVTILINPTNITIFTDTFIAYYTLYAWVQFNISDLQALEVYLYLLLRTADQDKCGTCWFLWYHWRLALDTLAWASPAGPGPCERLGRTSSSSPARVCRLLPWSYTPSYILFIQQVCKTNNVARPKFNR